MTFRLRTLLLVVTLSAITLSIGFAIARHREKVRKHHAAFVELDRLVETLDADLEDYVLNLPTIASQLHAANPINPSMALGRSGLGESMMVESPHFKRTFHYDWQLADGSRCQGVLVTVRSQLDKESLTDHVVEIVYPPNEMNAQVATWMEVRLKQSEWANIKRVPLAN